jgi:hypothetical protein
LAALLPRLAPCDHRKNLIHQDKEKCQQKISAIGNRQSKTVNPRTFLWKWWRGRDARTTSLRRTAIFMVSGRPSADRHE